VSAADIITVITALTTLVTAIGVAIVAVRQAGMKKTATETQAIARQTESLVNSRMDSMLRLLQDYRGAMQRGGVDIPGDDSIPKRVRHDDA